MVDSPKGKSRYAIPASMTEEGKQRERLYFEALGRFSHMFARMESALALSLWYYAKTPHAIARAVFSGVRTKEAIASISRIANATKASPEVIAEIADLATHIRGLTEARNDILHYGAEHVAEGEASVTNALKALTEEHVTAFPISPKILEQMTADCRKVIMHLRARHAGIDGPKAVANQLAIQTVLQQSWQYKHAPEHPLKPQKPAPEDRKKGKAQEVRQKSSPGPRKVE